MKRHRVCCRSVLVLLCASLFACGGRRPSAQQTFRPQPSFLEQARVQLRRDLPGVVTVVRVPAGADSSWVAVVRRNSPDTSGLARFNRAAPYFIDWVLGNTVRDHAAMLASLPATTPAQAILHDSLVADSQFAAMVSIAEVLLRAGGRTTGRGSEFLFDDLVTFATRFFRLETDPAQRVVFNLAAKSDQLRDMPIDASLAVEAWTYSFVRPAIEMDSLPTSRAIIRSVIAEAPAVRTRATLDSLERVLWRRLAAEPEFRRHIKEQLDRSTAAARMFSYRMAPDRPWADALITTYAGTRVTRLPDAVRGRFNLDTTLYGKYVDADGIPVFASLKVPNEALFVARDIINHMLAARADIRADIIERGGRVGVIANTDSVISGLIVARGPLRAPSALLPDAMRRKLGAPSTTDGRYYWNRRLLGVGVPFTICAEENLLGYPGTMNFGANILVQEFAFNILASVRRIDPKLYDELEAAFNEATKKTMYVNARGERHYLMNTIAEYWAEGTLWWFWSNYSYPFVTNGVAHTVWSPDDLQRYDPKLYSILARIYADHRIPADAYHGKKWR